MSKACYWCGAHEGVICTAEFNLPGIEHRKDFYCGHCGVVWYTKLKNDGSVFLYRPILDGVKTKKWNLTAGENPPR